MTDILLYFLDAITPFHLAITLAGTVVGIIIGALPGFTATMAIAVLTPSRIPGTLRRPDFFGRLIVVLCLAAPPPLF